MAIVFTAMAGGICLVEEQGALVFALCIVVLACSWSRLPHIITGLALGCIVALMAPDTVWIEGEHLIEGRVASLRFEHGQLRMELDGLRLDGVARRGRARLNVYQAASRDKPHVTSGLAGCRISTPAILKPPRPLGNSGEFDYERYLRSEGITITGYLKGLDPIRLVEAAPAPDFHAQNLTNHASRMLSDMARPEAEVLKAMLWGDRSHLTYAAQDLFAGLGLSHLIAISGLNIGIIVFLGYIFAYTIMRCLPRLAQTLDTPLLAKTGGLVCAVLFAAMVEPSYPTTRSVCMAVILIAALMFARRTALIDALSLSGCIILLFWPLGLFTPGFQLSFAAVLGLIVVLERMQNAATWKQFLAVPVVASAFTLPIAAYVFGFIAPLGILFNVIFVPLFSLLALPLGLMGLASTHVSEHLAGVCFAGAMDVISLILWTGERCGRLMPLPRPPAAWVYLCYLGLIVAYLGAWPHTGTDTGLRRLARPRVLGGICLALAIIPAAQSLYQNTRPLMFDFISVGQGDSILVTKGRHAVLIDAGGAREGFDTGRFVVGPHLLRRGVTRLDLAVITHSHPDHAGGMPFILDRFGAGQVWINVMNDRGFQDVTRVSTLKSIPVRAVCRGDAMSLNDMKIEVLHPQLRHEQSTGLDLNLHSVVVRIGDEHMTGLFMADAHRFGELTVIHGDGVPRADVLKAAHHGSAASCQEAFLDAVRPRLAVITCGYKNPYGMPASETLDRLHARGIEIYRSDRNGGVQIVAKHGKIAIKSKPYPAEKHCMFFGLRCM